MGESLGLGKKSSGPETDTDTWSWFRLPIPKPSFGRILFLQCIITLKKLSALDLLLNILNFELIYHNPMTHCEVLPLVGWLPQWATFVAFGNRWMYKRLSAPSPCAQLVCALHNKPELKTLFSRALCSLMPYPCSHFYFDIKFGDRLYSKENRPGSPLLFWI